jgi:hypothetical protein
LNISVSGQNGFAGDVQVTLGGLPGGVVSNPASPFSIAANSGTPVVIGAAASAMIGNFSVTVDGTSNALTHSASLTLVVQKGILSGLPRTAYLRTDSIGALDDPPGEPRHRRLVYDAANKHLFVANRAGNRVEVFSTADQTRVAQINIPGASSADLSADGSTVWVGTVLEEIVAIDTASLEVKGRYAIIGIPLTSNVIFDRPIEALALSNGKEAVRLRQPESTEGLLTLWDPVANVLTNLSAAPAATPLFQNGVGAMVRTGDRTKILVAANDASGGVGVFDANGVIVAGPQTLGAGTISLVAANLDGSRFAVVFTLNGVTQILLLNGGLLQTGAQVTTGVHGMTFSRDGKFLYASENAGMLPVITVLDGVDLHVIGQVPDVAIQGRRSEIEEGDETQLLFGVANRGASFIDASKPGAPLPAMAPVFAAAPSAQPSDGTFVGGTATALTGQNFEATAQVRFGTQNATTASVTSNTQIQTSSPPSVVNGAVNLTAYFPSGWLAIAPDAFSYGPQILEILPNAGARSGGDTVQIYGYGFGNDASKIAVNIGGASGAVQKVENVASLAGSLGLDASYPFSLERIALQAPAGTPGKADVTVTSPAGKTTLAKSFQYVQGATIYSKAGLYKFILYDKQRQLIYLSATDHVDVFDLQQLAFRANSILPPPIGPPPSAALRGMALTPDFSQLIVADFGAQNVYLIDPNGQVANGTKVSIGGVPGFLNSGPARVAATSAQTVFVGLSGEGGGSGTCNPCLGQLNLAANPPTIQLPAPQPQVMTVTGAPFLQASDSGDRVFLGFNNNLGGPVGEWDVTSPNQFTIFPAQEQSTDLAAAADGTMFAVRANGKTELRDASLALAGIPATAELEQIPGRVAVPGITMHPSAALVYQPFLTGPAPIQGGVDIVDAHRGQLRLRIFLPEPLAMLSSDIDGLHGGFLAVDENGQRIFALTTSGLTIVQLADVPLGIGSLTPGSGPAAGGTTITIRGSGFQSGIKATIGEKAAAVTVKDMNTLTFVTPPVSAGVQQMVLTNPDGEKVSLDAAFLAN